MVHSILKKVNKFCVFFVFSPLSFKNKFFKGNVMSRRAYKWNEKDMVKWPSCL